MSPRSRVCGPGGSFELLFKAPPRQLIMIIAIPMHSFFFPSLFPGLPEAAVFRAACIPKKRTSAHRAFPESRGLAMPATSRAMRSLHQCIQRAPIYLSCDADGIQCGNRFSEPDAILQCASAWCTSASNATPLCASRSQRWSTTPSAILWRPPADDVPQQECSSRQRLCLARTSN